MATPYFQIRRDRVASTQDVAREELDELPVLVTARSQTAGRGRADSEWLNADRALAASLAMHVASDDHRPFSLIAGVAAARVVANSVLKWPNDVMMEEMKVGGILGERTADVVIIGLGLNLWWPTPPQGMGAVYDHDPGIGRYVEIGGLWGAELMRLVDQQIWPLEEYRDRCVTLGREITWLPNGSGVAMDIGDDGGLVVETESGREILYSGVVSEIRG